MMDGSYVTADGRTIGDVVMDMRGITLRFGGVEAIKNISFDIREGEIRAIIGPNGAGKSTFLNAISGAITLNFSARVGIHKRQFTYAETPGPEPWINIIVSPCPKS